MRILLAIMFVLFTFSASAAEHNKPSNQTELTDPLLIQTSLSETGAPAAVAEPVILADSAILIEASTGRVIYEKNADVVRPPASMTKMMTCILGLEKLPKQTPVTIKQDTLDIWDTTFTWGLNEVISIDELLLGTMLVSDNGGAAAIADAVSGTIPQFAALMNEKAKEIGCTNTNFMNPHGLPDDKHLSTARDMAKIAMYCMANPDFRHIVSQHTGNIHWTSPANKVVSAQTTNELIGVYNGITGIKTGWTEAAGGCLAASAKRGDIELIAIVMHSPDSKTRFDDASKMLDYGFNVVKMTKTINKERIEKVVLVRDGVKAVIHVRTQEDLIFPLLANEEPQDLKITYDLPQVIDAEVKEGQIIGNAELRYKDKVLSSVPLAADETVERGFSFASFLVKIAPSVMVAFLAR